MADEWVMMNIDQLGKTDSRGDCPVEPQKSPSRRLVLLLAAVTGTAAANLYYAQPLLPEIAHALSVSEGRTALLVAAAQVGYALALAFVVPLGDLTDRRRLLTALLASSAVALSVAACAPAFSALAMALVVVGVTSSAAMIAVPLAASLAGDALRGQVVGTVMSGLLIGILVARTFSGLLADVAGWRSVYVVAAALMAVMAVAVRSMVPAVPAVDALSYRRALRSILELVATQAVLRQRMVLAAMGMACFTLLWTSLAFLLAGPGYRYSPVTIGLFGLAGLAGAVAAPLAGRLTDAGHARRLMSAALGALLISWGLLALGQQWLTALIAGIVLLDFALQGLSISHQTAVYALVPEARSRLTTALVVSQFIGGALASGAVSLVCPAAGWPGICGAGTVLAVMATAWWFLTQKRLNRA
ncbi:MFS transporter [Streptomyces sp. NPDC048277]|uniref:MFS transporter n=1 Tax=Streptomyces sp. NPDC048277 TaxID=3155027 RepID=UPI0033F1FD48